MTAPAEAAAPVEVPPLRRDREVQAWVVARGLSEAGDTVWTVALAWTAVHVAGPAAAGLLLGLGTLPRALCTLFGGVLADRWPTRRIVVLANAGRVLVHLLGVLLLGVLPDRTFAVLVGVTVAFGIADALHTPAAAPMARQMVRDEDVRPLMGMFQTVSRTARLVGAPLGGVLVAAFGIRGAMLVDAATFVLIGAVYAVVLHPRFPRALSTSGSWRRDLGEGLGYVTRTPAVRTLLLAFAGLNLFVGPALAVGVALRVSQGGWGAHTLGVVEACVGAGAAVGALVSARRDTAHPVRVAFGVLVVQGVAIALLGYGGALLVGATATLVGVTAGVASTYLSSMFVLTFDNAYVGRAQSVSALTDDALMPAAMAGFGALAGLTSVTAACVAAGLGMALLSAWSGTRLSRAR
ncbi:MAG: MFS transporter [Nocardioidaceae bacterium]|nr:MFS transporter [Nocardioidaceae bacterium]